MLLYIKQGLKVQERTFSPVIIIEDQLLQTFLHTLVAALSLAKSGILKGRKATTYHLRGGYKRNELAAFGAILGDEWLVRDEHIITSSCPKTAADVAFLLLEMLTSKDMAKQVKEAMGY